MDRRRRIRAAYSGIEAAAEEAEDEEAEGTEAADGERIRAQGDEATIARARRKRNRWQWLA
jgi:hypothetical protein